ncbi:hypothetical protein Leryth_010388 [Lithospermum erythrorhizon]|nr:hypothetical protein Leryth_010388 [Lithospermum erythrorhizon]
MESGIILKGTNSIADNFFIDSLYRNSTDGQTFICCLTSRLHLGVNSGAIKFAIEQLAANEATFQCPDEHGWKMEGSAIDQQR